MADIKEKLSEIDSEASMTLAVGWTVGKNMKIRQMILGVTVEEAFREVVKDTLANLGEREAAGWTPDADLSPETFLVLSNGDVGDSPSLTTDHEGRAFLDTLACAETLEAIHPKHLPTGDLSFYAVIVGDIGKRAAFIRRSNPRRGLRRGRIYSTLSDTLQRVEDPIFAFDDWIDLVSVDGSLCILSQTVFLSFFRDQETLAKKIPEWIQTLSESVSIQEESQKLLEVRVQKDSRLRARLEAIVRRDHLAEVSEDTLRRAMEDNELDPNRLLNDKGQLVLEEDDIPQILYLLNEDLFTGSLTNSGFRADKKAAR